MNTTSLLALAVTAWSWSSAPTGVADTVFALWEAMAEAMPTADFSRMYDFVEQEPGVTPRE